MKKIFYLILFIFLITSFNLYAVESEVLDEKLTILKKSAGQVFEEKREIIRRRSADDEMDEEEDPVYEMLWYIQKMNKKHPETLNPERKEYLDSLLNKMGKSFSNYNNHRTERNREVLYRELSEILITISEEILLVDEDEVIKPDEELSQRDTRTPPIDSQLNSLVFYKGRITASAANIRSGPSTNYTVINTLMRGTDVHILNKESSWYQILLPDNKIGFIYNTLIRETGQTTGDNLFDNILTGTIQASTANIRSGKGSNFPVIDKVSYGEVVKVFDDSGSWFKIETPDGLYGYIFHNLIYIQEDETQTLGSARINVSSANVRIGPGTNHGIVTSLQRGEIVNVLDKSGDWYRITMSDRQMGFIYHNLIEFIDDDEDDDTEPSDPAQPSPDPSDERIGQIIVNAANIRTGAGTNHDVITVLRRGETFVILQKTSTWYKIKMDDNDMGYVYETLIEEIDDTDDDSQEYEVATIDVNVANVRTGPSTNYKVVKTLRHGTDVKVIDRDSWSKIEIPDGRVGYVASSLLWFHSDDSSEPSEKAETITHYSNRAIGQSGTLYGHKVYTSDTAHGRLACVAVVSAILIQSDVGINKMKLYCPYMQNYLSDQGWRIISNKRYNKGDVVFWTRTAGDRARHIGIIVQKDVYGNWWTVDNSSSQLKVLKRPLDRSYYPVVLPAYRVE
ncbi:MAG: SH3 domain-containing protein [Candidatus Muiribacteriota bacterium]